MSLSKKYGAGYRLVWPLTVIAMVAGCLWFGADLSTSNAQVTRKVSAKKVAGKTISADNLGASIPGTGVGPIPDGPPAQCGTGGTPLVVTFDGSGLSGSITDVTVTINATHSWVGDVDARLVAPDATEHIVFSRTSGTTSATTCGSSDNLIGVDYVFNNSGTTNWWDLPVSYPAGTYTTTAPGGVPAPGGGATDMNAAFAGANPTGDWELRVRDFGGGDTGSINSASLLVTTATAPSGPTHVDFDGDAKTDYSIIRDTSTSLSGETTRFPGSVRDKLRLIDGQKAENVTGSPVPGSSQVWYVHNSMSGTDDVTAFGDSILDFTTPADFDGDGRSDIAVWRGVAPSGPNGGFFFIMNSSDSTVSTVDFGVQGDNPTVVGDYDGDGNADPAVFRCPATAGQCNFFYKGSAGGGEITYNPWGFGTSASIFAAPGDFDGDGKYDFNIQRTNPTAPGKGQFVLLRSSDSGIEFINWGNDTDFIIPGDYDGDGQDDITVGRSESGLRVWYTLYRTGGTNQAQFGLASDFITPGDYDGDGTTDISIFRPDADPNNNFFWVLRSSDLMIQSYEYGQNFDYPLPNWQVN